MKDFLFLSNIKCGKEVTIKEISISDYKIKTRLHELGFFVGTKICLLKKSFFNKTFLIKVGTCEFIIRKDIANKIKVVE